MFFDYEKNEIGVEEFINLYEPGYFLGNEKVGNIVYNQSSRYVEENEIMPILKGHIDSYKDFAKIMAWKIGKIKHRESEAGKKIIYASDWDGCEENNPKRYGKEFQLQKLAKYILDNRDELERLAVINPQECLNCIQKCKVPGIGPVYMITILFFLSHGECPIYDRFAMASLLAYEKNLNPFDGNRVKVSDLPSKGDGSFSKICENQYAEYIGRLDDLKYDYKKNRRLDRALWVYGHACL